MSTSRIDDLRIVDPVLTSIAQGFENSTYIAEKLFPTVKVSKLKGKIPVFGKDAFVIRATERAIRASSNRIMPSDFEMITFNTQERDIETAIDYLEEEESPDYFRYEQRVTKNLVDILKLGKEKEAADLAQNENNYSVDMYDTLTSDTAFSNYESITNPLDILKDAMNTVRNKISRYPNTMVIGISAFDKLMNHPMLTELVKYSGLAKLNKNILEQILNIDEIHVGTAVYSADGEVFSDVWADNVILAYVDKTTKQKRSEYNPSFGYTLQRDGKPEIDTYYENGGKLKVIRNTDNYGVFITSGDAAYLIKNTVQ
ncbi:hypothetical protein MASR1M45_04660 [Candidatus Kapaibacterium sp.]